MRIGILTFRQAATDEPRYISNKHAKKYIAEGTLVWLVKGKLAQEVGSKVPSSDNQRFLKTKLNIIPRLLPPTPPDNFDLSYPERNRSGLMHPHEAFRRECQRAKALQKSQLAI